MRCGVGRASSSSLRSAGCGSARRWTCRRWSAWASSWSASSSSICFRRRLPIEFRIAPTKRGVLFQIIAHPRHFAALAPQIIGDGAAQAGMRDVVRRMRGDRAVAARQLVFPLSARLDNLQLALDGEVDGLMVADLEMQKGMVFDAAPVAAEQRVG